MTNSERFGKGISSSDLCLQCHLYKEIIMHILRDCKCTLELWEKIVNPAVWHRFACLGFERWLELNLQWPKMNSLVWNWPIVFASMVHMLWIDQNHFIFSGKTALLDLFLPKVFDEVYATHCHLLKLGPSFIDASYEIVVQWSSPPLGVLKLNTNGSYRHGHATCGCLIHNSDGQFANGFFCNLGVLLPLFLRRFGGWCMGFGWLGV